MGNDKRLKKHVHRAMKRRLTSGKKPMSKEQKEIRKKARAAQSEASKKALEKSKK